MWDDLVACKNVVNHVIKKREKAPNCTICGVKLFNFYDLVSDYTFHLEYRKCIHRELGPQIWEFFYQHYPFWDKDKQSKVKHHVDYKKDISIFVCTSCHSKIHTSSDPKYTKWKPVDKRPKKDQHKLGRNVYKPIKNITL